MIEATKDELKIFDRATTHIRSEPTLSEQAAINDFRRASFIAGYRQGFMDGQVAATKREFRPEPPGAA